MSTEIEKDILCPQCGESQKYRLFASINAKENPELKRRVLSETLFDWRCKRCNYFAAMAYSFLYTDPEAGYMVAVTPAGESRTAKPPVAEKGSASLAQNRTFIVEPQPFRSQ